MTAKITGFRPLETPAAVLLHITPIPLMLYKNSLFHHLLNKAKALTPAYWNQVNNPTIKECEQDLLTDEFKDTWTPWIDFLESTSFTSLDIQDLKSPRCSTL
ncbi:Hypothetical predicted protein [Pelobates cultripes]|uniref:Uncharacterized protein n=1 Tax=Pelobates cultripes TaxID=61616 RepID=A0AAD1QY03_PELCU|nr:Hypothetical predicted protein [Pelobates cultripes]